MNTTQLECFLMVANYLNFSRAAQQLRITQPAVSHQINTLEDELGVKLFSRSSKTVRLTRAGLMFIQNANEILKMTALSKTRIKEFQESFAVRLGIGCHNFLELRLLKETLKGLCDAIPQCVPSVRMIPFSSLDHMLEEDEVQVMFTFKEEAPARAVYRELTQCPMVCICAPGHPLSAYEHLTLEQLNGCGRIAVCPPAVFPDIMADIQTKAYHGRKAEEMIFCDSIDIVYTLVEAGCAFAVMPLIPHTESEGICYIPLEGLEKLSYGAAYKRSSLEPALKEFLKQLEALFKADAGA